MELVSIIVPVYNCAQFLNRCMDSLVNQTLKDIEIICINDGSTDNSPEILQEYAAKDSRIKIINKENGGLSSARNRGLAAAQGEYLGFVDSDDWVDLDFFEKLYNAAKKYDTDIATGGIIRLHKYNQKYHLKFDKETVTSDFREKLVLCDLPDKSYVWNKIYKREMFVKCNLKFEEGRYYEDIVFSPQSLYYLKTMVTVPDTYYYYWRHSKSIVRLKTKKTNDDKSWALKTAEDFLKSHNIDLSDNKTHTKRYKIFGLSVFKISTKGKTRSYRLFNIIKWSKTIT